MAFLPVAVIEGGLDFEKRGWMIVFRRNSMMNSGERISRACPNRMLAAIIAHDGELHVSREDVNAMAERSISRLGSPHGEECKIIRAFKHIKPWSPRS